MRISTYRNAALALLLALALPWAAAGQGPKTESEAPPAGPAKRAVDKEGPQDKAFRGWQESFPAVAQVQAAGEYGGSVQWNLESFSPLCLEPSATGRFRSGAIPDRPRGGGTFAASRLGEHARTQLVFEDTVASVTPSEPGAEHFFKRSEGAVTALGWVDEPFRDMVITGLVNTEGGREGKGSVSRQGLMGRWDRATNFYWFHVDFAMGEYGVLRASHFGVLKPLEGSVGKVAGFDNTKAYNLEFALVGDTVRGRVYDPSQGAGRGKMVGDTGWVKDADPWYEGVAGVLAEPALKEIWRPLEGSFANVAARALGPQPPKGAPPAAASVADKEAEAKAKAAYEKAVASRNAGDVEAALVHYYEALRFAPDHIDALNDVAWIRAASAAPELRDSKEAVFFSEKAMSLLVRGYNLRRDLPAGVLPSYDRVDVVRVALTLAAALGSDGVFKPTPVTSQATAETYQPAGATAEETREAIDDSESNACAATAAEAAVEFAESEQRRQPRPEVANLIRIAERHAHLYEDGRVPYGEPQP